MLSTLGPVAETSFRKRKIISQIQSIFPAISGLEARYMHYIDTHLSLDGNQEKILNALLSYGKKSKVVSNGVVNFFVIPRIGTISPWSSKATDIANICGLPIKRIERGRVYSMSFSGSLKDEEKNLIGSFFYDRMTESLLLSEPSREQLFKENLPSPLGIISLSEKGKLALNEKNNSLSLALSDEEIDYLYKGFSDLEKDPTDVELMMFAQANSEHCRHKVFNAKWLIDSQKIEKSLFQMIKNTYENAPNDILSAYHDNAAVVSGPTTKLFYPDPHNNVYDYSTGEANLVIKVETHNHPTAISPFPGASTGSGGEIRDEGATGRGARPKAGLTGFTVSHLEVKDWPQTWESNLPGYPSRIVSALDIMLEAPIGAAQFNNEFGRPNLLGYFRTCLLNDDDSWRGYHKPIMIAGGLGNIVKENVVKKDLPINTKLIVLGGPAMLIGLGGGAASSLGSGSSDEELDFASVQRGNPEMQRRAQEVINSCWTLGTNNPVLSIHDIGAGGLCNAVPEIIHQSSRGAIIKLRQIPNDEFGMSPMELWCNESQERYILAVKEEDLNSFINLCKRERCTYAIIGDLTEDENLKVVDDYLENNSVSMPMELLFGKPPKLIKEISSYKKVINDKDFFDIKLLDAINQVIKFPAVADKSFLIHIGDRSVGGLSSRDQLVGPWQIPVSDVAVTSSSFIDYKGEAMAIGERTPVAIKNGPASARLAVAEAITNISSADIVHLGDIKLSANWMAASGYSNDDYDLFKMVEAIGEELCPSLGIAIPVGKDSMSMVTKWKDNNINNIVASPVSLIISSFAPVNDVRRTLTPELSADNETSLIFIDLSNGKQRMGGSCLSQSHSIFGGEPPDLNSPKTIRNFFECQRELRKFNYILAYHDRSDGGLFIALCEMSFASRLGLEIDIPDNEKDIIKYLFNEELGVVIQVRDSDLDFIMKILYKHNINGEVIAKVSKSKDILISQNKKNIYSEEIINLHKKWSELSYRMQRLRDNPECADEAYTSIINKDDPGLSVKLTFKIPEYPSVVKKIRPKIAILREQGVNSHIEMAASFDRAGFQCQDVHMSDLLNGEINFDKFKGLAACGGFSYGDVLGAGEGWAKSILYNSSVRDMFQEFFNREDSFVLGVCNGCQMIASLKDIIPGAERWPKFIRNRSDQFEARFSLVKIEETRSIFFSEMAGSVLPIVTSHGEGRVSFSSDAIMESSNQEHTVFRYVDNFGKIAETYPANPNGSPNGIAGLTNEDGKVTIMMPHPERVFRTVQNSWHPSEWKENSPWQKLFNNAYNWTSS